MPLLLRLACLGFAGDWMLEPFEYDRMHSALPKFHRGVGKQVVGFINCRLAPQQLDFFRAHKPMTVTDEVAHELVAPDEHTLRK